MLYLSYGLKFHQLNLQYDHQNGQCVGVQVKLTLRIQVTEHGVLSQHTRGENQMEFPRVPWESHGNGNHWAKVPGMRMGVAMSQREWEGIGILLFYEIPEP